MIRALDPTPTAETASVRLVTAWLLGGIAAALIAIGLWAWLASAMVAGQTSVFDEDLRLAIQSWQSPAATAVLRAVSRLGSPPVVSSIAIAIAILFFRRGWRRAALLLPVAIAGGGLLNAALKNSFQRLRPSPLFDYPLPTSYSFPSGHAVWSFCLFGVLAALLSPRIGRRDLRAGLWAAAASLILAIGISRVYLGVHHPSDVLAGWGAAFVWTVAVACGDRVLRHLRRDR